MELFVLLQALLDTTQCHQWTKIAIVTMKESYQKKMLLIKSITGQVSLRKRQLLKPKLRLRQKQKQLDKPLLLKMLVSRESLQPQKLKSKQLKQLSKKLKRMLKRRQRKMQLKLNQMQKLQPRLRPQEKKKKLLRLLQKRRLIKKL
jgi:hypothetical protein